MLIGKVIGSLNQNHKPLRWRQSSQQLVELSCLQYHKVGTWARNQGQSGSQHYLSFYVSHSCLDRVRLLPATTA